MINQCTRIGNIAGLYGNHRLCIWEIENMDISNQGGRRIGRQTFLTLTFSERYHYKLVQDFPSSTQPWNPLSMFFPVLDTCLFSPSSSSSSTWQVSQIQPVIFNKLLKLSTGFVLEDLEMTKQWLFAMTLWRDPRLREWSWKKELAPETPASRQDTHWSGHKN